MVARRDLAAVEAALLNVAINLGSLRDEVFRVEHERLREDLARRAEAAHARALEAVQSQLG
jgi:formiminotetrahydrofolate cyclodeaminase